MVNQSSLPKETTNTFFMQTNLYLHSLQLVLAEHGIGTMPDLNDVDKGLLKEAHKLAGGTAQKATTGERVDSIFSHLKFKDKTGQRKSFPQKELSLLSDFFPGETGDEDLKTAFEKEIKELNRLDNDLARAETLLFLLHKYGTTMPSGVAAEISLYDYAKSKAAFAQCLAALRELDALPTAPFLLVGGDMSGIQEFLYDIVSTNASKNLKGRSYYLHLLGDTILTCLLAQLELPQANVVYASGGSFYVLAPNTPDVKNALTDFEKDVKEKLFAAHKTLLSFIIDCVEFSEKDKIGEVWDRLNKKFDRKKRAKFNPQLLDFGQLFDPEKQDVGGDLRRDVVTGEEILDGDQSVTYFLGDSFPKLATDEEWADRENVVSKPTAHQIMMGLFLKSTMYRMNGKDLEIKLDDTGWEFDTDRRFRPAEFDINQFILDGDTVNRKVINAQPQQTLSVNTFDFLEKICNAGIKGFELYGGNAYPQIRLKNRRTAFEYDAAKTFSELAGMEDDDRQDQYVNQFEEAKFKRLGILRMDVDNLGLIFKEAGGLNTLAHYSALSRQLDWFFKGYLNTLWDEGKTNGQPWKDHTQIIYSGGDDLFIVGKWDCLIDFAEKIRHEFVRWTCQHEGLGISGGIVLVTPKFPVIKAADICEKAEKNAKKHKTRDSQKNAFSLFGYPLNWQHEWPKVQALKTEMVGLVREKAVPKSLLMMLAAYHELKKEQLKSGESPTWRWQIAYNLTRLKQRVRPNEAYAFIEKMATSILVGTEQGKSCVTEYEYFDLVAVAVRWAEYELRSDTSNN